MTTLQSRIRDDVMTARRAKDTVKLGFLSLLLSEASRPGKDKGAAESTDDEVARVIKKFMDNTELTLKHLGDKASDQRTGAEAELAILREYMPVQADPAAVQAAIVDIVSGLTEKSPKQMGVVMGQLTARFGANFDKTIASASVRAELAKP